MPDRHSELPAHPDLEYYRKQAKHLQRSYEAGDAAARDRAAEVLGDRAAGRFLLSDAQFVLAQEHGFRTWAEFRAGIQSQRTTGGRPASRLWGTGRATTPRGPIACSPSCAAATRARCTVAGLCAQVRRCHRRLHRRASRRAADHRPGARLPDLAGARGGRREIPARCRRTPGEVAAHAPGGRSPAGRRHRPAGPADRRASRHPAADARRAGDPRCQARRGTRRAARRRRCADRQGHQPGPPAAPGRPLRPGGVRAAAARRRRRPRHPDGRHHAAGERHRLGNTQMVDLLAEHGIIPQALWTYAACGRLDLVQACFDADGRLRPDAALRAPTPPTSSLSHPGSRRPTIRRRSWPRRSSTPASTAGPRSCAGSSTAAQPRRSPLPRADRTAPGDPAPAARGGPLAPGARRRPVPRATSSSTSTPTAWCAYSSPPWARPRGPANPQTDQVPIALSYRCRSPAGGVRP